MEGEAIPAWRLLLGQELSKGLGPMLYTAPGPSCGSQLVTKNACATVDGFASWLNFKLQYPVDDTACAGSGNMAYLFV